MGNRFGTAVRLWATALLVAGMGVGGNASATLLDRGPDLVYDDVLNITWTRQAGDGVLRDWANSVDWANNLVFAGFDDWRLPWASVTAQAGRVASVVNCSTATEIACRDNEMGYMFYINLGGVSGFPEVGNQTALGGEVLTGIQFDYWSGTECDDNCKWVFTFTGRDVFANPGFPGAAWAVRPGDVAIAAVPEPASLLLFGLGALGLGWTRRRGRRR